MYKHEASLICIRPKHSVQIRVPPEPKPAVLLLVLEGFEGKKTYTWPRKIGRDWLAYGKDTIYMPLFQMTVCGEIVDFECVAFFSHSAQAHMVSIVMGMMVFAWHTGFWLVTANPDLPCRRKLKGSCSGWSPHRKRPNWYPCPAALVWGFGFGAKWFCRTDLRDINNFVEILKSWSDFYK